MFGSVTPVCELNVVGNKLFLCHDVCFHLCVSAFYELDKTRKSFCGLVTLAQRAHSGPTAIGGISECERVYTLCRGQSSLLSHTLIGGEARGERVWWRGMILVTERLSRRG